MTPAAPPHSARPPLTDGRRLGLRFALAVVCVGIGLATLSPTGSTPPQVCWDLICGDTGTADAVLNVLLFIPLGAVLAALGWRWKETIAAAAVLVITIELLQLSLPGRTSGPGDVAFNTLGAAVGQAIAHTAPLWTRLADRTAMRLSVIAAGGCVIVWGATGALLSLSLPPGPYHGQWTPHLGRGEHYRGAVLSASLDAVPIPHANLANADTVRALLHAGTELRVRAFFGVPNRQLADVFSITDAAGHEVLLFGPERTDFVVQRRRLATALHLQGPDYRFVGPRARIAEGDTVDLAVTFTATNGGACLTLRRSWTCAPGLSLGSGWTVLVPSTHLTGWWREVCNLLWVALIVGPVGFWGRRRWGSILAIAGLAVAMVVLPPSLGLHATMVPDYLGAGLGIAAGAAVRRRRR